MHTQVVVVNLIFGLFFVHKSSYKILNEKCEFMIDLHFSRPFQQFKECPIWKLFVIFTFVPIIWNTMKFQLSKWENHLGVLGFILSHLHSWECVWVQDIFLTCSLFHVLTLVMNSMLRSQQVFFLFFFFCLRLYLVMHIKNLYSIELRSINMVSN